MVYKLFFIWTVCSLLYVGIFSTLVLQSYHKIKNKNRSKEAYLNVTLLGIPFIDGIKSLSVNRTRAHHLHRHKYDYFIIFRAMLIIIRNNRI